jgi:hypothetical protein
MIFVADFCSILWLNLQLAVSMASRAAALARELKNIKSELHFMHERCGLLEEENKRLREGCDNGVAPEEDDLVLISYYDTMTSLLFLAEQNSFASPCAGEAAIGGSACREVAAGARERQPDEREPEPDAAGRVSTVDIPGSG